MATVLRAEARIKERNVLYGQKSAELKKFCGVGGFCPKKEER